MQNQFDSDVEKRLPFDFGVPQVCGRIERTSEIRERLLGSPDSKIASPRMFSGVHANAVKHSYSAKLGFPCK